jgi:hypothetical protein
MYSVTYLYFVCNILVLNYYMAGLDRGSGRRVISSFFVVDGVPIMFYSICACVKGKGKIKKETQFVIFQSLQKVISLHRRNV